MQARLNFNVQPHATNIGLHSLREQYLKDSHNLTLRPPYQRNLCWSHEQKSNLIDTIMSGCPMPIFLLYMFNDENECIDGQNRLTTIKEYFEQLSEPFPWKIVSKDTDGNDMTVYVFYQQNDGIDNYIAAKAKKVRKNSSVKEYRYMTSDERKRFHNYEIVIQKIQQYLTLEQRKDIFIKWQSGRPITQCERFKNESYPFCLLVVERGLEMRCADLIAPLLKSGKDNWLYDLYRMLLVFRDTKNMIEYSAQNTIAARVNITKPDDSYNISNEEYMACAEKLLRFLNKNPALNDLPVKLKKLSFVISFCFIWFNSNPEQRAIIQSPEFVSSLAEKCLANDTITYTTLNNGPHSKELSSSFPLIKSIMDELISEKMPLQPVPHKQRKKDIPESVKNAVWVTYIGSNVGETACLCCGLTKITQRDFQCAHIIPAVNRGKETVENLRPTCLKCNQSCGTKNLREFMAEHYPQRKLP